MVNEAPAPGEELRLQQSRREPTGNLKSVALLVVCTIIAVAILICGAWVPRGVGFGALYVIPVVLVQRAGSTWYTVAMAVVGAALASLGLVLSPDIGVPPVVVIADYAIVLVVLAATAILGIVASRRSAQLRKVTDLLTICAWTKKVKVSDQWVPIEDYLTKHVGVTITHGMSEESMNKLLAEAGLEGAPE